MDVNAVSGPANNGGPENSPPAHDRAPHAAPASMKARLVDAAAVVASLHQSAPRVVPERGYAKPVQVPAADGGGLKFDIASSDVLARFWIDESSNRVVITMYDRGTGEVIRQTPPREVLDTVAVLEGCGLAVDRST